MKKVLGLIDGRHKLPVDDYIFDEINDVKDINGMAEKVHQKLKECKKLTLYTTGLTVALLSVVNYCCLNHIPLVILHYDNETKKYFPQEMFTRADYDLLVEGGYYRM